MSPNTYALIQPVEIKIVTPGNEHRAEKVETVTVSEVERRSIEARIYFAHGDVTYYTTSAEGSFTGVELDDRIDAYLSHQLVDPKKPDTAQVFEALTLPDCWVLRNDVITEFRAATAAARLARSAATPDVVKLIDPFESHGAMIREIRLVEPKHRAFRRFGMPWTYSRLAGGEVSSVERIDVIAKYVDGCIDHELGKMVISYLSLADAIQLKMAVLGFFTRAAETADGARKSTASSLDDAA